jgi:hypothetical protein
MTITMLIGSFIGGATSEGGGAVAFPVMTLVLKLAPSVARDFSLMIQCCGENPFQPFLKVLITLLPKSLQNDWNYELHLTLPDTPRQVLGAHLRGDKLG